MLLVAMRTGVGTVVYIEQTRGAHVRVLLGGGELLMAKQFLNAA
jgi:hypothetical protein